MRYNELMGRYSAKAYNKIVSHYRVSNLLDCLTPKEVFKFWKEYKNIGEALREYEFDSIADMKASEHVGGIYHCGGKAVLVFADFESLQGEF